MQSRWFRSRLARLIVCTGTLVLLALSPAAEAQIAPPITPAAASTPIGTAITYQGQLTDNNAPANGLYDFQFIMYDLEIGGSQQGSTVTRSGVQVNNGLFTVLLDFGQAIFYNKQLFLETGVKASGAAGSYTTLSPRTTLAAAPYALSIPGLFVEPGTVRADGNLGMSGVDFFMTANDRGDGGRALVHDNNDTLVINYANDFSGGTVVGGELQVNGGIHMISPDFVIGPSDRGDGGRAFVHWENDELVINFNRDFAGGVGMGGPLNVGGGSITVSGGDFIDLDGLPRVPTDVFTKGYSLMSIDKVAAFIEKEKHLPGMPSQEEIQRNGLNLSEFQMKLLEKVEELTLYTVAQQAEINAQQAQIQALEARLTTLEAAARQQ